MVRKSATAAEGDLAGTYKLISTTETMLETGQAVLMKHRGSIMYGRDGRMMVVIVTGDRPKPASIETITDQERVELFRSMVACGGTYKFDGKTIEHHIDVSSNEVWTGTSQVRDVKREGGRLILITRPAPDPFNGKMASATLVWEKVE